MGSYGSIANFGKTLYKIRICPEDTVVVSPDVGGSKELEDLQNWLHTPLAVIDKRRAKANVGSWRILAGDVKGKRLF